MNNAPTAKRIDAISVAPWECEGTKGLTTPCRDSDAFWDLPTVVEFEGARYARSGWNSDRGEAYYRDGTSIATRA